MSDLNHNVINTYVTNVKQGRELEGWLQFYFHNPKNLDLILSNLNIRNENVANEIVSTQINYRYRNLVELFSRTGQVVSRDRRDIDDVINSNTDISEAFDDYEVYLLQINNATLVASLYKTEHSRSYHKNYILANAMLKFGYPRAQVLLSAIVANLGFIREHTLRVGDNVVKIVNFLRDLNFAADNASGELALKIDVMNANETNLHKILDEALDKVRNQEFFKNNPTLMAKMVTVLEDAKVFLYGPEDQLLEAHGYCHANLRWNTLFETKNRLMVACDYSDVYYGNVLDDFAKIISRLMLSQSKINKLLDYINSDEIKYFDKRDAADIRLAHLFVFMLVDVINIIDRASKDYFDVAGGEKEKSTINLEHIDSIEAFLITVEVEFRPYYTHPEHMLSNGKITLYDFANLYITYLSKVFEVAVLHEERHAAKLQAQQDSNLLNELGDIKIDMQEDEELLEE